MAKKCTTPAASKARQAINRVTEIADLRLLARHARERADKLMADKRAAEALVAWDALEDGALYVLAPNIGHHSTLIRGVVYRAKPYRKGRKHRGTHLVAASIEDPKRGDHLWLDWARSLDLVRVDDDAVDDEEKAARDLEFRGHLSEVFSR